MKRADMFVDAVLTELDNPDGADKLPSLMLPVLLASDRVIPFEPVMKGMRGVPGKVDDKLRRQRLVLLVDRLKVVTKAAHETTTMSTVISTAYVP
jgi:hypothetical protein